MRGSRPVRTRETLTNEVGMPRIYTSRNDPVDFCQKCFLGPKTAEEKYSGLGDGPDGRGNCYEYDAFHPDYSGEDYVCAKCKVMLTDDDNQPYPSNIR